MEQRKASDILLELENKINTLTAIISAQDLNIKVLSNKLNTLIKLLSEDEPTLPSNDKVIIPASTLNESKGSTHFSRTSRPDTVEQPKPKIQPKPAPTVASEVEEVEFTEVQPTSKIGKISTSQRIVDKNGNAIFMANVEIINAMTQQLEAKVRTSSIGKWQAVLAPGIYKVKVSKMESVSKAKIEFVQEIKVTGQTPTQEFPIAIVK